MLVLLPLKLEELLSVVDDGNMVCCLERTCQEAEGEDEREPNQMQGGTSLARGSASGDEAAFKSWDNTMNSARHALPYCSLTVM